MKVIFGFHHSMYDKSNRTINLKIIRIAMPDKLNNDIDNGNYPKQVTLRSDHTYVEKVFIFAGVYWNTSELVMKYLS